ncbi:MAG: ABC transporter substrate-binding protein [Pseudomonadota bacterium]
MFRKFGFASAAFVLASAVTFGSAHAQTEIKFTNDWKFEGPSGPLLLAVDKGYFAEEGLDVTVDTGAGSRESIPRVASGTYPIGFGDVNALIKFKDQNPELDVKAVMMVYDAPPFAVIGRKSLGVSAPKDLEGKVLGAPPPDAAFDKWPAFVELNDLDTSGMTIESVGFPIREPMLAQGKVQAIFGFSFSSFINLKANDVPEDDISVMLMSDFGLDLYGNVIIVNPDFAAENPDAVKGFLRAYIKGWKDAVANPQEAIDAVLKRNDVARNDVEVERLEMAINDNVLTDWVKANGFGGIDESRFANSIEQLGLAYEYKTDVTTADIFTSEFLPPAEERMLP